MLGLGQRGALEGFIPGQGKGSAFLPTHFWMQPAWVRAIQDRAALQLRQALRELEAVCGPHPSVTDQDSWPP